MKESLCYKLGWCALYIVTGKPIKTCSSYVTFVLEWKAWAIAGWEWWLLLLLVIHWRVCVGEQCLVYTQCMEKCINMFYGHEWRCVLAASSTLFPNTEWIAPPGYCVKFLSWEGCWDNVDRRVLLRVDVNLNLRLVPLRPLSPPLRVNKRLSASPCLQSSANQSQLQRWRGFWDIGLASRFPWCLAGGLCIKKKQKNQSPTMTSRENFIWKQPESQNPQQAINDGVVLRKKKKRKKKIRNSCSYHILILMHLDSILWEHV